MEFDLPAELLPRLPGEAGWGPSFSSAEPPARRPRDTPPLPPHPVPRYTTHMQIGSLLAVYFVVWWLTFVAVLPIGSHSHHEMGSEVVAGTDPGAPVQPRLIRKALLTTVLSIGLTALLIWAINTPALHDYWNR